MESDGSSKPRRPPHITVNSGSGRNLLGSMSSGSPQSSTVGTPGFSMQLVPPQRSPTGQSSQLLGPGRYSSAAVAESSEMLLPSSRARAPRSYQEASADNPSQSALAMSSRGTSWDSEDRGRDSRRGASFSPITPPFDGTQTVSQIYDIVPSAGLLVFPEELENDDYLHNPDPSDRDRERRERRDIWNKRALLDLGSLVLITVGILLLLIGYPVLTLARQVGGIPTKTCSSDRNCLSDKMPLLRNQRIGLIDPDTPKSTYSKTARDGTKLNLVFSDEFNTDGRTFYDGDDPYFQAVDIWYGVTQDLEWYDPDAVTTANGTLNLKFDAFQSHNLNYRSGMVQSWNKLCFKGGRLEASISLPGRGDVEGFWPGFWAMGNLGRPGYPATTDGLWPYSYWDKCDAGITPNQSSPDGLSFLPGMRLPACTCKNQDHPSRGKSRSAPEIDALEASVGFMGPGNYDAATGTASQSFQAAPFDIWYQPDYDFLEIYDNQVTGMNIYRGGPYQEAVSGVTWLNNDWYSENGYQKYGFEYHPGASGDIAWFVGDEYTWKMDYRAVRPNGNIGQRVIPEEPMTIVMNFGMSNSFATVFLANLAELMPATMRFDYVRIYQEAGSESVTCDPPGYPTTTYIKQHPEPYNNPNLTLWKETGYNWPTNTLVNGCT